VPERGKALLATINGAQERLAVIASGKRKFLRTKRLRALIKPATMSNGSNPLGMRSQNPTRLLALAGMLSQPNELLNAFCFSREDGLRCHF
jgi:hypothetical protein